MKTKKGQTSRFPVARIKKIMQADEDVGKVAQATPLMVSKAAEMFMQSLVASAAEQASRKGSKKVQAYHLKQAINSTPSYDFLKDLVSSIPDPMVSSEGEAGGEGGGKKKRKRKSRAKAKTDSKGGDGKAEDGEEGAAKGGEGGGRDGEEGEEDEDEGSPPKKARGDEDEESADDDEDDYY